jgi:hypothetical protein
MLIRRGVADSGIRNRNAQVIWIQNDLDSKYVWIPKLDVAGSTPVSRSKINNLQIPEKHTLHSPPLSIKPISFVSERRW